METISPRDDQNKRYWLTMFSFVTLVALATFVLFEKNGQTPQTISVFDFFILSLACFRLIRLFTYDQIARAIRDLFVEKKEFADEHGQIMVIRRKVLHGGRRSLADLFSCPWCMGMWVSFFVVFLFFLFPPVRYAVIVLAVAGVGSMIQILMNMIGSRAEFFKRENNIHN